MNEVRTRMDAGNNLMQQMTSIGSTLMRFLVVPLIVLVSGILCGCCEELDVVTVTPTYTVELSDTGSHGVAGLQFTIGGAGVGGLNSSTVETLIPGSRYPTLHISSNSDDERNFILLSKRGMLADGDIISFNADGWLPTIELSNACDTLGQPLDVGDLELTIVRN